MKKLFNLFSIGAFAASVMLSSCGKTDDPKPGSTKTFADSANTYTAKLMGAQNNAAGSYFASSTGLVYLSADAKANPGIIDITFAEIGSAVTKLEPKLISPDYRDEEGIPTAFAGGTITYFKTSTLNFATVSGAQLAAITPGANKSIIVAKNATYEFVNAAGKKGLVKVTEYVPNDPTKTLTSNGSITIDVKVQK